jgi:hypothetical protein
MIDRPLSTDQVKRLEESLRRHHYELQRDLADENRDSVNLHIGLTGNLRGLLCDGDSSSLLVYAKHRATKLRVWGPYPPGFVGRTDGIAWEMNALAAAAVPTNGVHEMSIEEYLDTPLGATIWRDQSSGQPKTFWYTPRMVIKSVAEKDGGVHLELKPYSKLEAIRMGVTISGSVELVEAGGVRLTIGAPHDFVVRSAILQIAQWVVVNLECLLGGPTLSTARSPGPQAPV